MRFNTIVSPAVTPPEVRPDVGAARGVAPVSAQRPRREVPPVPGPRPGQEPAQAPATIERRQDPRRGDDRRKRQLPVLIDTRVAQRRRARRRAADAAPSNVDTEA